MLKFIDKILLALIGWLYLKHTAIYLKLQARDLEDAPPYNYPEPEVVDQALAQFGMTREELAVRMGGGKCISALIQK